MAAKRIAADLAVMQCIKDAVQFGPRPPQGRIRLFSGGVPLNCYCISEATMSPDILKAGNSKTTLLSSQCSVTLQC